jgi:glycosyltransferase involved in cell wall biosynthesis
MPIYQVTHRRELVKRGYERSPVIALETDLASKEEIPATVQSAADSIVLRSLDGFRTGKIPRGADGVMSWLAGDRLLQGTAAAIRRELRTPGRRCFVTIHFPCLTELDLLCLEPRWLSAGQAPKDRSSAMRIASAPSSSPRVLEALKGVTQPWAQLLQALLAEQAKPGSGVELLVRMANDSKLSAQIGALALRNLLVLLIHHKEMAKAEQVLEAGLKAHPGYAELSYIGAVLYLLQQKGSLAVGHIERARVVNRDFVGSGGENSYRASWLMGGLAARVGNQKVAFENFYQGMVSRPVFTPAVDELLNLRLSPALVEKHQYDFCRLVRQEPQYLDSVFDYLLLHRAFPAARRIVETMPLAEEKREVLRQKLETVAAPFQPGRSFPGGKPGIILSGPFLEHSSFARINREVGASLLQSLDFDACLEPSSHPALLSQMMPCGDLLAKGLLRHPKHLDLTIRHQWLPDFQRPARGKLAVIVPWEYGTVPRVWVRQIEQNVDELWVPSNFVREVFVHAGVSPDRVCVIPNGFDPKVFSPEGAFSRPKGCRKFMFLFVGGAIRRKGIDLLLEAYKEAFDPGDDVTLVVSTGANPAYTHNSLSASLSEFVSNPRLPHLAVLTEQLDDTTLASLYRGCDAFVLPYRGEGFGMPILEAMACGKAVITTAQGPSRDFCSPETAYLVSASEARVPEDPPPLGEMAGEFTWFEPDVGELAQTMLHVYQHSAEAAQRGRAAAKVARQKYNWSHITQLYRDRVRELAGLSRAHSG